MKNQYNNENYELVGSVLERALFIFTYEYDDDYSKSCLSIQNFTIFGKDGSKIALQTWHPQSLNNETTLALSIATDYYSIDFEQCSFDLSNLENIERIEMDLGFEEPVTAVLLIGTTVYPVTFL
ncbi:hypothetical protein LMH73_015625 [Vibrio splendidus]|nr:hypothetical protein [Vibrio splendidus]MCC4882905.1 hypothetical protein [Vibrio splendidus]